MESPRHRLISARANPMVEMARWLFELNFIPYAEEAHVPILHVLATRRAHGGNEVPVVVTSEGVWRGAKDFLFGLDAKTPPGRRLLGNTEQQRRQNIAHIIHFFSLLLLQVRRYVYFHLLPHRKLLYPVVTQGAPFWERSFVLVLYPVWRRLMAKGLDLSPNLVTAAPAQIDQAFSFVEQLLADGREFIGGELPGIVDVVFASLVAPLVLPPNYGAQLPRLEGLPTELRNLTAKCRERRAGQLALSTYEKYRPRPQQHLTARKNTFSVRAAIFTPAVQRRAANLLRRLAPRFTFGRVAIFSTWSDVNEILSRDVEFLIAPVNGAKINEVTGPFILGLDRSEKLIRERGQMYAALALINFPELQKHAEEEARRLLAAARARNGKIDVVNGYARLVAARTAVRLFGLHGPAEAELMRVARLAFHYIFLNLGGDNNELRKQAITSGEQLKGWIQQELKDRTRSGNLHGDVLGAMLARRGADSEALDDDGVCRTIGGLLIGAIDTTATAVAQVTSVLLSDSDLQRQLKQDIDQPDRVLGWCWEALRLWTHNPLLLRHANRGTSLGGKPFKKDMTAVALTLAAMNDPLAFPFPDKLDPSRPRSRYFHFGGGLHPCAGRSVNGVQVPLLVRELVKAGARRVAKPRFAGPFIDELVVTLETTS